MAALEEQLSVVRSEARHQLRGHEAQAAALWNVVRLRHYTIAVDYRAADPQWMAEEAELWTVAEAVQECSILHDQAAWTLRWPEMQMPPKSDKRIMLAVAAAPPEEEGVVVSEIGEAKYNSTTAAMKRAEEFAQEAYERWRWKICKNEQAATAKQRRDTLKQDKQALKKKMLQLQENSKHHQNPQSMAAKVAWAVGESRRRTGAEEATVEQTKDVLAEVYNWNGEKMESLDSIRTMEAANLHSKITDMIRDLEQINEQERQLQGCQPKIGRVAIAGKTTKKKASAKDKKDPEKADGSYLADEEAKNLFATPKTPKKVRAPPRQRGEVVRTRSTASSDASTEKMSPSPSPGPQPESELTRPDDPISEEKMRASQILWAFYKGARVRATYKVRGLRQEELKRVEKESQDKSLEEMQMAWELKEARARIAEMEQAELASRQTQEEKLREMQEKLTAAQEQTLRAEDMRAKLTTATGKVERMKELQEKMADENQAERVTAKKRESQLQEMQAELAAAKQAELAAEAARKEQLKRTREEIAAMQQASREKQKLEQLKRTQDERAVEFLALEANDMEERVAKGERRQELQYQQLAEGIAGLRSLLEPVDRQLIDVSMKMQQMDKELKELKERPGETDSLEKGHALKATLQRYQQDMMDMVKREIQEKLEKATPGEPNLMDDQLPRAVAKEKANDLMREVATALGNGSPNLAVLNIKDLRGRVLAMELLEYQGDRNYMTGDGTVSRIHGDTAELTDVRNWCKHIELREQVGLTKGQMNRLIEQARKNGIDMPEEWLEAMTGTKTTLAALFGIGAADGGYPHMPGRTTDRHQWVEFLALEVDDIINMMWREIKKTVLPSLSTEANELIAKVVVAEAVNDAADTHTGSDAAEMQAVGSKLKGVIGPFSEEENNEELDDEAEMLNSEDEESDGAERDDGLLQGCNKQQRESIKHFERKGKNLIIRPWTMRQILFTAGEKKPFHKKVAQQDVPGRKAYHDWGNVLMEQIDGKRCRGHQTVSDQPENVDKTCSVQTLIKSLLRLESDRLKTILSKMLTQKTVKMSKATMWYSVHRWAGKVKVTSYNVRYQNLCIDIAAIFRDLIPLLKDIIGDGAESDIASGGDDDDDDDDDSDTGPDPTAAGFASADDKGAVDDIMNLSDDEEDEVIRVKAHSAEARVIGGTHASPGINTANIRDLNGRIEAAMAAVNMKTVQAEDIVKLIKDLTEDLLTHVGSDRQMPSVLYMVLPTVYGKLASASSWKNQNSQLLEQMVVAMGNEMDLDVRRSPPKWIGANYEKADRRRLLMHVINAGANSVWSKSWGEHLWTEVQRKTFMTTGGAVDTKMLEGYCDYFVGMSKEWAIWLMESVDGQGVMSPVGSTVTTSAVRQAREDKMFDRLVEAMFDGLPADFRDGVRQEYSAQMHQRRQFGRRQVSGRETLDAAALVVDEVMKQRALGHELKDSAAMAAKIAALEQQMQNTKKAVSAALSHRGGSGRGPPRPPPESIMAMQHQDFEEEIEEGMHYLSQGPVVPCKYVDPKTNKPCNPGKDISRHHDAKNCWKPHNPKSSISFTLRRFKDFDNFAEICGVLCKYSSDGDAFRSAWDRASQADKEAISLEDIRREFSENPNLTAKKNGESKVVIGAKGITEICGCDRFSAGREKITEAFRECWIPKMYYALLNASARRNDSVACMSEEDFIFTLIENNAQ